jgi:type I restriction-modification system DNA methylase subunit
MTSAAIVQKLWNYCNVLRDDGMSYGDYVEQLTYLLVSDNVFRYDSDNSVLGLAPAF